MDLVGRTAWSNSTSKMQIISHFITAFLQLGTQLPRCSLWDSTVSRPSHHLVITHLQWRREVWVIYNVNNIIVCRGRKRGEGSLSYFIVVSVQGLESLKVHKVHITCCLNKEHLCKMCSLSLCQGPPPFFAYCADQKLYRRG